MNCLKIYTARKLNQKIKQEKISHLKVMIWNEWFESTFKKQPPDGVAVFHPIKLFNQSFQIRFSRFLRPGQKIRRTLYNREKERNLHLILIIYLLFIMVCLVTSVLNELVFTLRLMAFGRAFLCKLLLQVKSTIQKAIW